MEGELQREEAAANAQAEGTAPVREQDAEERVAQDVLRTLQLRFPDLSPDAIAAEFTKAEGHAGHAARELRRLSLGAEGPPKLARLSSPESAGGVFPEAVGPFALVSTRFTAADFLMARARGLQNRAWTMSPSSLGGQVRKAAPDLYGVARIAGRLSRAHPITLPPGDRQAAGIPDDAVSFAWSYPIEQRLEVPSDCATNPDLTFLALGGFVYFDADGRITKVLALVPSATGGLCFGRPFAWQDKWTKQVGISSFRPVTIDEMRKAGARRFTWAAPGEIEGLEHGGFAYIFQRIRSESSMGICFPVVSQGAHRSTDQGGPPSAPPAASAAEAPTLKSNLPSVGAEAPWDFQVSLAITPPVAVPPGTASDATHHSVVSVQPPAGAASHPSSICIVLDVSGSMRTEATLQDSAEQSCLSLLDIAKHGVRTVMHSLGVQDKLSLVTFNSSANVIFPPMQMNEAGRQLAEQRLQQLEARGGTDIWEGLNLGLGTLLNGHRDGVFDHIMLLTDGFTARAESVMSNLVQYKGKAQNMPCSINTFGFGYRLDSTMLAAIASEGCGSYSFIPDAGFIGTVFVNCVGNLLVTMAQAVYVNLEAGPQAEILADELPAHEMRKEAGYLRVKVGNLQYGQNRDIVVPMRIRGSEGIALSANGQYRISQSDTTVRGIARTDVEMASSPPEPNTLNYVERHRYRAMLVDMVPKAMAEASRSKPEEGAAMISGLATLIAQSPAAGEDEALQALRSDLTGQVSEAMSRGDWYEKWGTHYLPSLTFAHKLQQCNNFKDPGVQVYGGELFETVRDVADETFNRLPPPEPSLQPRPAARSRSPVNSASSAPAARSAPVSMAAYNDRYGG